MEQLLESVKSKLAADPAVSGLLAVRASATFSPSVDGFDVLLLVVTEQHYDQNYINHYSKDGKTIQERWISQIALEQWIFTGRNRGIIEWILHGEICVDRAALLESIRRRLLDFPDDMREQKLFIEFSLFLHRYMQSKQYLKDGHFLDAHSNILSTLQHWARIVIIEQGFHPEVTVWEQVRKINPGVYKLYEELTTSEETIEQRVQLILLACEFNVMSKLESCCQLLIRVLKSRPEPFSPVELKYHPTLDFLRLDIALVLKQLVKRGLVREVVSNNDNSNLYEVRYTAS